MFEIVVVDGGSTDGSLAWLKTQRPRLGPLISGHDAGVYDAMNKGLAVARGEWVLFLGADDRLAAPNVLAEAARQMTTTGADVAVGEAVYSDGRVYALARAPRVAARNFVHHQAAFYRRGLFVEHGAFDSHLAIMADYEMNLRLWRRGVTFASIPLRIAECSAGGLSDRGGWRGYREEIAVRHRHLNPLRCLIWDLLSLARFIRKQMVRRFSCSHG